MVRPRPCSGVLSERSSAWRSEQPHYALEEGPIHTKCEASLPSGSGRCVGRERREWGAFGDLTRSRLSMVVSGGLRGGVPVLERRLQDPAAVELSNRGTIELLPGRVALRGGRGTVLAFAALYLLVRH